MAEKTQNKINSGTLYVVATPIGNLSDLTLRAAEVFKGVDFIAAEDTRVTVKLLNHLGIKKQLISYYEHNLKQKGDYILDRIASGESCALCSDAGTPAISDPGELIVKDAHDRGIKVVPIPAASAAITALCVSGQITGRFVFEGFLPTNKRQKKERIQQLLAEERTMIFYEAPHKLNTTLKDLCAVFEADRPITICRELTKMHEQIIVTTLEKAMHHYAETPPKGEFVLVMAGAQKVQEQEAFTPEQAVQIAKEHMQNGDSVSMAAKKAAAETSLAKNAIYKLLCE